MGGIKMNRRWVLILFSVLGILMFYEIFNNDFSILMLLIGISSFYLRTRVEEDKKSTMLFISLIAIALALISSEILWLLLIVLFVLILNAFPEVFRTLRKVISDKKESSKETEFVMVRFDEEEKNTAKISKNQWIGEDSKTTDEIYQWEDINFTKLIGNTIFDLGNTILRKEQNIILIRKGIGDTKLIIPKGVAVSLDISMLLGELKIQEKEIILRNETFKWTSENYEAQPRKIKLVANVLVGEVEVIFL